MERENGAAPPDNNTASPGNDGKEPTKPKKKRKNKKIQLKPQQPVLLIAEDVEGEDDSHEVLDENPGQDDHDDFDCYTAQGIARLPQGTKKNPRAAFVCSYCQFYCRELDSVDQHLLKHSHKKMSEEMHLIESLSLLSTPPDNILNIIDECLSAATKEIALTVQDCEFRNQYKENLNEKIISNFPGCYFELYGSSVTRIGYKSSNVNLNFNVPSSMNGPKTMSALKSWLEKQDDIVDVEMNVSCHVPLIKFRDRSLSVLCDVALNDTVAVKLSVLLADYCSVDERAIPLALIFRYWAEVCNLTNEDYGGFPKHAFVVMTVSYLQHVLPPVLPIVSVSKEKSKPKVALRGSGKTSWKSLNRSGIAELWLGLLNFFSVRYPLSDYSVAIDRYDVEKRRSKKLLWITDPLQPKKNVARTVISDLTRDYALHCMRTTFQYFSIPQTITGPIYHEVIRDGRGELSRPQAAKRKKILDEVVQKLLTEDERFQKNNDNVASEGAAVQNATSVDTDTSSYLTVTLPHASILNGSVNEKYVYYTFSHSNFTGGKEVPLVCMYCFEDGHTKDNCPLKCNFVLEELTQDHIMSLDKVCEYVVEKYAQNASHMEMRKAVVMDLEECISKYYPDAKLHLFGSTCNGFGLKQSDLDICLTLGGNETGKDLDYAKMIDEITFCLGENESFKNLFPITTAKVPIVKFTHADTDLDGDISVYNILALNNTRLLKTYSDIDYRFKVLGCVMKHFAKRCNICDASRGSLSSYAYTLMVIYFLQQCDPPVLPVLQELPEGESHPEKLVEGYNVYFFEDIHNLHSVWPHVGKNTSTVGRLWCELLHFYAEKFNFETYVVSIRQKEPLLRFSKMWTDRHMAIEDPFDLNHNLASAISKQMYLYITKALRRGQVHLQSVIDALDMNAEEMEICLFSSDKLMDEQPPVSGRRNGNGGEEKARRKKKKKETTDDLTSDKFSEGNRNLIQAGGKLVRGRTVYTNENVLKKSKSQAKAVNKFERAARYGRFIFPVENLAKKTRNVDKPTARFEQGIAHSRVVKAIENVSKDTSNHKRSSVNNHSKTSAQQSEHKNQRQESGNNRRRVFVRSRVVENSSLNVNELHSSVQSSGSNRGRQGNVREETLKNKTHHRVVDNNVSILESPVCNRNKQEKAQNTILENSRRRRVVDIKNLPNNNLVP